MNEERDRAIEEARSTTIRASATEFKDCEFTQEQAISVGAAYGFNEGFDAGVAHERKRIADKLDSILTSYGDNDRISDIHDFIERLRKDGGQHDD
jgi:hypothetical protein